MRPTIRGICLELEVLGANYIFFGLNAVGIVLAIFAGVRLTAGLIVWALPGQDKQSREEQDGK